MGYSRFPPTRRSEKEAPMRKAISIAGLLVILPAEQVLAHAVKQERVRDKE